MSVGTRVTPAVGVLSTNNTSGLQVDADSSNTGFTPYRIDGATSTAAPLSAAFTVTSPGFYWVSGSLTCTGTIPTASDHPGALLSFGAQILIGNAQFMLTGTARSSGTTAVFVKNGAGIGSVATVIGGGVAAGDKLTVPNSGSVALLSDGRYWVPIASSGSLQIQA